MGWVWPAAGRPREEMPAAREAGAMPRPAARGGGARPAVAFASDGGRSAMGQKVRRRAAEGCWRRWRREIRARVRVLREHDANRARWEEAQTAGGGGRLVGVEGEGGGAGGWAGREREEAPAAGMEGEGGGAGGCSGRKT
jgi:hypothetical protein